MSLKPLFKVLMISAVFALITGFLIPITIIDNTVSIKYLSDLMASAIPVISIVAERSISAPRAEFTWAVQWIFFLVYCFVFFRIAPPWGQEFKAAVIKKSAKLSVSGVNKKRTILLVGIFVLSGLILADFGIGGFSSFIQGSIFNGEASNLSIWLRAPFTSNIGMVIYGWLFPLIEAVCYWGFVVLILNIKLYWARVP